MDSDSTAHLQQWKHNRALLELIPPDFPDWIVTVAFYTALQAVDSLLAFDKVRSITSHDARNSVLGTTNRYRKIYRAYQPLYSLSRTVRYLAKPEKWVRAEDIEANVLKRYLYRIEASVSKLAKLKPIGEPIVLRSVTTKTAVEPVSSSSANPP